MTWTCRHCGTRYPDSSAERQTSDGRAGCLNCTEVVRDE